MSTNEAKAGGEGPAAGPGPTVDPESPYQLLTGAWGLAWEADGPDAGNFLDWIATALRAIASDDPRAALHFIEGALSSMRHAYHHETKPDMRIAVALDGARLKLKGMLP